MGLFLGAVAAVAYFASLILAGTFRDDAAILSCVLAGILFIFAIVVAAGAQP